MTDLVYTGNLPLGVEKALSSLYSVQSLRLQELGVNAFVDKLDGVRAIVVIPGDPINEALINSLPDSVGLIASYSTGVDHIDVPAAQKRGIAVSNTPDVLTDATADIALLLTLGAARGAGDGERLVRSGEWTGWNPNQIFGIDLNKKIFAVFGFGRIGQATARRALAFGMEVIYYSRSGVSDCDDINARFVENFDDFLSQADVLSLHAPATPETRNIVNKDSIEKMKDGVIIVNTARGELVDDEALLSALECRKVRAVGLDVFNGEPNLNSRYKAMPNTFLLPHIGSSTEETRKAMGDKVLDNLAAFFAKRPLPDEVRA